MSKVVKLTLLARGTFVSVLIVFPSSVPLIVLVPIGESVLTPLKAVLPPETEFEAVEGSLFDSVTDGVVCEGGDWVCSDGVLGDG